MDQAQAPSLVPFAARVLAMVRLIPPGRVATYGDIASLAGRPKAWRSVGTIMRKCGSPTIPCHRVVGAGGRLGGYHNLVLKQQLLRNEGVSVGRLKIHHFSLLRWRPSSPIAKPL